MKYASLHNHCHFSLDGVGTIEQWINAAKRKGIQGIAITDHGNCSSMLELYTLGKELSFPVILGSEFYVVDTLLKDKENKRMHLTVWVKNLRGYKNICKLSSMSFDEEHFYSRPRIAIDELLDNSEGLIVGSGCIAGPIGFRGVTEESLAIAQKFKDRLGGDFYLELMPIVAKDEAGNDKQKVVNETLLVISKKLDIPLIVTSDSHMPDKEDKILQDIKMGNSSKGGWKYEDTYSLPELSEFLSDFNKNHPYIDELTLEQAVNNTNEILSKTRELELNFKPLIPRMAENNGQAIMKKVQEYGRVDLKNEVYRERLIHEIDTVKFNGTVDLTDYFLILEDVCRWCRENDMMVGPGRGSAAGSLLAYALRITDIDPIEYDLLFSRFLNEARIKKGTLPDIDLDFEDRDVVINYIRSKYGEDKVCKLGTVTTLKLKSAVKDAMRALQGESFDYAVANAITKNIPDTVDTEEGIAALSDEMDTNIDFQKFMNDNKGIMDSVFKMVGQNRQMGIHASGIAISPIPLTEIMPLGVNKGVGYTQYTAKWCELAGIIKFDILTVNTLSFISNCLKNIEKNSGKKLLIEDIPLDDKATYDEFKKGNTDFVFQFNSDVSQNILKKVGANSIEDLSQVTAIGRPGPMDAGMDKEWIARRRKERDISYPHPSLADVLKKTDGVIVYQEQVMRAFQILADFTEPEADDVRKAAGKKDPALMLSFKDRFITNIQKKFSDVSQETADKIWNQLETFARYGFNKSHSVAYARIGYLCQYLKTHYPIEWWLGVAKKLIEKKKDKISELYKSARDFLELPDINVSGKEFFRAKDRIVCPLTMLNGIGDTSIDKILECRDRLGYFTSLEDFLTKINGLKVRKDVVECLIWAGCFNKTETVENEKELLLKYYNSMLTKAKPADRIKLQKKIDTEITHINQIDASRLKNEALGIVAVNLEEIFKNIVDKSVIFDYNEINKLPVQKEVKTMGIIDRVYIHTTKNGQLMAFVTVTNNDCEMSLTLFPEKYIIYESDLLEGRCIQVDGIVSSWKGKKSVIVEELKLIS